MADVPADGQDLLEIAIGERNTDFYLDYCARNGTRDWRASWNWPAFFVTFGWLLYRKMWVEWLVYAFAVPIVGVVVLVLGVLASDTLGVVLYYVVSAGFYFVLTPMYANAIYAAKLQRLLDRAEALQQEDSARAIWVARRGGTSFAWMIALVLLVPIIGIVAAVALPAYQSYIQTANSSRVAIHYEYAVDYVDMQLQAARSEVARGAIDPSDVAGRDWVAELRELHAGVASPEGAPAFADAVDHGQGTVGVAVAGAMTDVPISYAITISRPAYGDLADNAPLTVVIRWRGDE